MRCESGFEFKEKINDRVITGLDVYDPFVGGPGGSDEGKVTALPVFEIPDVRDFIKKSAVR